MLDDGTIVNWNKYVWPKVNPLYWVFKAFGKKTTDMIWF